MAEMAEPITASSSPNKLPKWITGLGDKLGNDGLQLLKLLHRGVISQRQLEDDVQSPKDLYDLAGQEAESDDAALALFIHRIYLLVPLSQPTAKDPARILEIKDLGAKACLDYLRECDLSPPSVEVSNLVSDKSKLMECLVTAYVNMSPRKRQDFREQLADQVGVYREGFNIFELVCRLFQRGSERAEQVVGRFVNALNKAPVPRVIVENLRDQLVSHGISEQIFEDITTEEETEVDYTPPPKPSKPFCTRKKAIHCLVAFIPVILFVLAIAIATPSLLTRDKFKSSIRDIEVSGWTHPFIHDYCGDTSKEAPLIRLGTVHSRWYYNVLLTQMLKNDFYYLQGFMIYAAPSEYVTKYTYTKNFSCSNDEADSVDVDQLYLLQGSVMTFNICVSSSNPVQPGWVNFSIYNDFESYYNTSTIKTVQFHQINVSANETYCPIYEFMAPNDSFYYVMSGNPLQVHFATVVSFSVDINIKYVNWTELLNGSHSIDPCYRTEQNHDKPCSVALHNDWFFSAREYDIFVFVTSSPYKYHPGLVKWKLSLRTLWYAVPAIAGGIVIFPIFLITVAISCCVYRRKPRRRRYKLLK
jgi:hypothetical protein